MNTIDKHSTLVPVDFSETSAQALEHAVALAKLMQQENPSITILHVLEGIDLEPVSSNNDMNKLGKEGLAVEGAINRMKRIVDQRVKVKGSKFNYVVAGGKPYRTIAEIAEKLEAELIVMGTHGGDTGMKRFIGSNASRVIQISDCPVVTLREHKGATKYKDIVLPLDLTRETKQKVAWAIKVAKYFSSTIHIISIHEDDEFLDKRVRNNMHQVESFLKKQKLNTTSEVLTETTENFAKATLHYAKKIKADLLIIMTQQEKTFSEYVFGSYAQQIVKSSTVPVMSVNPRADLQGKLERLT